MHKCTYICTSPGLPYRLPIDSLGSDGAPLVSGCLVQFTRNVYQELCTKPGTLNKYAWVSTFLGTVHNIMIYI